MSRNAFGHLKNGLERAISHARGEIRLDTQTVQLPDKPAPMSAQKISALRIHRLGLSQRVFAKVLNAAPQTVQAWEQGRSKPSGCALRFLELLEKHPEIIDELVRPISA
ncbi:MAG: type II toxin-antitoxin system MqsA family antitoxin [Phycisphaerae bacterium]|nr:type II toxin-antitoxin system MqsA family antitoxin [Phycisphaerae bacterium]